MAMGETAENVADLKTVSREEQEKFSLSSQFKAAAAKKAGKFKEEIVSIVKKDGTSVTDDGCLRPETTVEGLAKLKPAFKADGSVTAGTSSPVTDGASAVLVCSEDFAKKNNLEILAEITSFAVTGLDPDVMGMGPVSAAKKALDKAGLTIKDIDVVELNEAFASQSVACIKELGLDPEKVNKHGGAIALGHPLGASGARITGKAAKLLHDNGGEYAMSVMCIGGGQGIATILKKPDNSHKAPKP
jgi:acetyl-CoA acyltransferase